MDITIDTNILINAFVEFEPDHLKISTSVGKKCPISVDVEQQMMGEYEKNLGHHKGYRKWLQRLWVEQAFYYCNGKLSTIHREKLTKLECHEPSDHVFIAVAYNSGKILVSEDSDMGKGSKGKPKVLEYLQKEMELTVCDAREAGNLF